MKYRVFIATTKFRVGSLFVTDEEIEKSEKMGLIPEQFNVDEKTPLWHFDGNRFLPGYSDTTRVMLVYDNIPVSSLSELVNPENDFLIRHRETNDEISKLFNPQSICHGNHIHNSPVYGYIFKILADSSISDKAETIVRELFLNKIAYSFARSCIYSKKPLPAFLQEIPTIAEAYNNPDSNYDIWLSKLRKAIDDSF